MWIANSSRLVESQLTEGCLPLGRPDICSPSVGCLPRTTVEAGQCVPWKRKMQVQAAVAVIELVRLVHPKDWSSTIKDNLR